MHYRPLLVHSLWEQLWIEKMFRPKYPADLRKHCVHLVDTKVFSESFIHSLQLGLGILPIRGHIGRKYSHLGEGRHALAGS